jgi:predicted esterase
MKHHRARIAAFLFADFIFESPKDPKRLVILLHGYEQTGQKMYEKLASVMAPDAAVLSPNGPFPLPRRTQERYRLGYSWYFYDPKSDEYVMDMEIAVQFIKGLVQELGLTHLPITLIGFSQGGYLAPLVAQELKRVDHVIGLGAEYLVDEMALPIPYRADAVHGELDDVVSASDAQVAHQRLMNVQGNETRVKGEFRLLNATGHCIDKAMQKAVAELMAQATKN